MPSHRLTELPEPWGFLAFVLRVIGGVAGLMVILHGVIESTIYLYETVHPAAGYAAGLAACLLVVGVSLLIEARFKDGDSDV